MRSIVIKILETIMEETSFTFVVDCLKQACRNKASEIDNLETMSLEERRNKQGDYSYRSFRIWRNRANILGEIQTAAELGMDNPDRP